MCFSYLKCDKFGEHLFVTVLFILNIQKKKKTKIILES